MRVASFGIDCGFVSKIIQKVLSQIKCPHFFSVNDLLYKCITLVYCRRQSGQILRLRGGNNPHIGFLQINIQGSWQLVKQVLKFLQHE